MKFVAEARRALPLVPSDETDCCARLVERTDLTTREAAREWVTFLVALGLAERTRSGFRRLAGEFEKAVTADAFREHVFGTERVLDAVSTHGPLGVDEVFERIRADVPQWERHRVAEWETVWRERVRRLLEWTVIFDLTERAGDEYRVA